MATTFTGSTVSSTDLSSASTWTVAGTASVSVIDAAALAIPTGPYSAGYSAVAVAGCVVPVAYSFNYVPDTLVADAVYESVRAVSDTGTLSSIGDDTGSLVAESALSATYVNVGITTLPAAMSGFHYTEFWLDTGFTFSASRFEVDLSIDLSQVSLESGGTTMSTVNPLTGFGVFDSPWGGYPTAFKATVDLDDGSVAVLLIFDYVTDQYVWCIERSYESTFGDFDYFDVVQVAVATGVTSASVEVVAGNIVLTVAGVGNTYVLPLDTSSFQRSAVSITDVIIVAASSSDPSSSTKTVQWKNARAIA